MQETFKMNDLDYRKLLWRARRGMWELDQLLVPYCEEVIPGLSTDCQDSFARLLKEEDVDLLNWFSLESSPEDNELRITILAILDWKRKSQGIN